VTISPNVFSGKGTASPSGKQVLMMLEASGLTWDCMNPSSAAAFGLPSPPDNSSPIFEATVAFSCGFKGCFALAFWATGGISTLPPSESAQALAARDPMLYASCQREGR